MSCGFKSAVQNKVFNLFWHKCRKLFIEQTDIVLHPVKYVQRDSIRFVLFVFGSHTGIPLLLKACTQLLVGGHPFLRCDAVNKKLRLLFFCVNLCKEGCAFVLLRIQKEGCIDYRAQTPHQNTESCNTQRRVRRSNKSQSRCHLTSFFIYMHIVEALNNTTGSSSLQA